MYIYIWVQLGAELDYLSPHDRQLAAATPQGGSLPAASTPSQDANPNPHPHPHPHPHPNPHPNQAALPAVARVKIGAALRAQGGLEAQPPAEPSPSQLSGSAPSSLSPSRSPSRRRKKRGGVHDKAALCTSSAFAGGACLPPEADEPHRSVTVAAQEHRSVTVAGPSLSPVRHCRCDSPAAWSSDASSAAEGAGCGVTALACATPDQVAAVATPAEAAAELRKARCVCDAARAEGLLRVGGRKKHKGHGRSAAARAAAEAAAAAAKAAAEAAQRSADEVQVGTLCISPRIPSAPLRAFSHPSHPLHPSHASHAPRTRPSCTPRVPS